MARSSRSAAATVPVPAATYLGEEAQKKLADRLSRLEGHVRAVRRMVLERRCADDILGVAAVAAVVGPWRPYLAATSLLLLAAAAWLGWRARMRETVGELVVMPGFKPPHDGLVCYCFEIRAGSVEADARRGDATSTALDPPPRRGGRVPLRGDEPDGPVLPTRRRAGGQPRRRVRCGVLANVAVSTCR